MTGVDSPEDRMSDQDEQQGECSEKDEDAVPADSDVTVHADPRLKTGVWHRPTCLSLMVKDRGQLLPLPVGVSCGALGSARMFRRRWLRPQGSRAALEAQRLPNGS